MKYLQIPTTIWSQLMAHLMAGYYCFSSVIKDVLFIPRAISGSDVESVRGHHALISGDL